MGSLRQGDTFSPYLLLLVIETLAINPEIDEIKISKNEVKLLQ